MYFEDGPMVHKPNFSLDGKFNADNLFSSSSGMPSVDVGSYPFDAKETVKSIKRLHTQFEGMSAFAEMMVAGMVQGVPNERIVKSAAESIKLRNSGNQKYHKNCPAEAAYLYTQSIANASEGSLEQVLAFGNRSAALLRLGELESCLHDINRALQSDLCPQSSREKLDKRKVDCLSAIRRRPAGNDERNIETNDMDPINLRENDDNPDEWRALCQFNNPLIPNASAKFKIVCNEKWGRHLVATDDIEPGEVLSIQKFNALVLRDEKQKALTHCSYCLSKCLALIPCPTCTESMYCSKYCRSRAYESYHRVECKLMHVANRAYKLRAMRMLIEGTEQGARIPELMKQIKYPRDIMIQKTDPSNKPFVNDYLAVLKMSRTFNSDLVCNFYTFVWNFISELRGLDLYGDGTRSSQMSPKLSETEVFTAMLLMNHATTARSHSFSIVPAHVDNCTSETHDGQDCMCDDVVGIGICALHSMINHSCDSNVNFLTRNRKHVLFANRPIKKGEQLFHAYWKQFQLVPKQYRNEMLSMFFGFKCECKACTNDWPTVIEGKIPMGLVFLNKNRNKLVNEVKLRKMLNPITGGRMVQLDNEAILKRMVRISKWLYRRVKHPSFLYMECEAGIAQFMNLTYGLRAKKYTREQVLEEVESFFESIEKSTFLFP